MEINQQVSIISSILGKTKRKNHEGKKNPKKVDRHIWSIKDEELAISLYLSNSSKEEIKEALKETDIKLSSMLMKLSNLRYLDTGEGLENVSETTKTLFMKYKK